jgi:2-polyprenyl-3-methyl-5-hydroxy-6-metoxy-1,4-benzoquinol methylase
MPEAAHDCPVCATAMVDHFKTEEADYTLCPKCDYLFAWAKDVVPLDLNVSLYNERFDQNLDETRVMDEKRRRKYRRFLGDVQRFKATGRLLDIGCGSGRLLQVAVENGWEAWGSDPAMGEAATRDDAFKIVPHVVNECGFIDGMFDVVHANEVIEHISDLAPFIAEVSRILRPGGVAIFRTPHHRSWTAQMVGAKWRQYEVFEKGHVGFVTSKTMAHLFSSNGMKLERVITDHFSLRDRYPIKSKPLKTIVGRFYDLVGQVAKAVTRGERIMVWGVKNAAGAENLVASDTPVVESRGRSVI